MQEIDRKEEQILYLTLAGQFSPKVLDQKHAALEKERSALAAELREAEANLLADRTSSFSITDPVASQDELREVLHEKAPIAETRRVLTFWLAEKIVV